MEHHLLGEETLASMLIATYSFHEEGSVVTQALVDMIMTTVRIFDEYLLPLHLSKDGPDDTSWMISGLLALLQHMERVDHVVVVQRAKAELILRLRMYPLRFQIAGL